MMQDNNNNHQIAVFAGGCFWCTEAIFNSLRGVVSVTPGYTGGHTKNPKYQEVLVGNTGHVEATKIEFDSTIISYDDLLSVFFNTHDPTTLNRQGNDIGTQYRSVIFYTNEEQLRKATALVRELDETHAYDKPIVTEVQPLGAFYDAGDYHNNYYEKHKDFAYCELIIGPKLEKLQKRFAELMK